MRRGVSFSMAVLAVVPRYERFEPTQDIETDVRVGVLVYHQTAGCMLNYKMNDSFYQTQLLDRPLDLARDGYQGLVLGCGYFNRQGWVWHGKENSI